MKKLTQLADGESGESASADLARRLSRYRSRLKAEGRERSLKVLDRAIRDASEG
jgi:hypothetical protein